MDVTDDGLAMLLLSVDSRPVVDDGVQQHCRRHKRLLSALSAAEIASAPTSTTALLALLLLPPAPRLLPRVRLSVASIPSDEDTIFFGSFARSWCASCHFSVCLPHSQRKTDMPQRLRRRPSLFFIGLLTRPVGEMNSRFPTATDQLSVRFSSHSQRVVRYVA